MHATSLARRKDRQGLLNLVIDRSDVSEFGLTYEEHRVFPTIFSDASTELATRTRESGSLTAWRSLRRPGGQLSVWSEIVTCANPEDAKLFAGRVCDGVVYKPLLRNVDVTDSTEEMREIESETGLYLSESSSGRGARTSTTRIVAGSVGSYLYVLGFGSAGSPWNWEDAVTVANRQRLRLETQVGENPPG
jgi:hypothetical protein